MCHECDDEYEDDVEFNSESVDRLQELPTEVKNQLISELQDHMSYIMDKAEQNGFLFELITEWPRQKVAMYEAAVVMQRQILNDVADDHNH